MASAVAAFHPHHEPEDGHVSLLNSKQPREPSGIRFRTVKRQQDKISLEMAHQNHARSNARTPVNNAMFLRQGVDPVDFGKAIGSVFSVAAFPNAANHHPGIRDREQAKKMPVHKLVKAQIPKPEKGLLVERDDEVGYINIKGATLKGEGAMPNRRHTAENSPRAQQNRSYTRKPPSKWDGLGYGTNG